MTRTIVIGNERSGLDGCEENYSTPKIALVYEMNIVGIFWRPTRETSSTCRWPVNSPDGR